MRRPAVRPGVACLTLLAALFAAGDCALAAEDCSDLARIPDCPTGPSPCTPATCPPQDCSTCTAAIDDDRDCALDEEILNGADDDGDGLVDEDISCLESCDPMRHACPVAQIAPGDLGVPAPIESFAALDLAVRRYGCAGTESTAQYMLIVEPDPVTPNPSCGNWQVRLRVYRPVFAGITYLMGPALLVYSRSWDSLDASLLTPPARGTVRVFRFIVKADLALVRPFASLSSELQIPCLESAYRHVFFYGALDVAMDSQDPSNRRFGVVLHHAPSSFSHPPTTAGDNCESDTHSTRPLAEGGPGSHDDGFFLVAPSSPSAPFAFASTGPVLTGDFRYGRIRTVPQGPGSPCETATRICVSQWEQPPPPGPTTLCGGRAILRNARFCGEQADASCTSFALSSDERCGTIPNDLVAFFPVGAWTGPLFPAPMEVSAFEGALSCVPPLATAFRPYQYGIASHLPNTTAWHGPPDALDIVDNQHVTPSGAAWLVGACNWAFEGAPNEQFWPAQFRTMNFFADQNPDIPRLAPCRATAVITMPAPPDCTGVGSRPRACDGAPLALSAECSTVVNCCQCGRLEYQWSRNDGVGFVVVDPWSTDAGYLEDPAPLTPTGYRLEVRCTTSPVACVSEAVVTIVAGTTPPAASPTATPADGCAGGPIVLDAGACPTCTCDWSADPGIDEPADECTTTVTPDFTTTYTVVVADGASGCAAPPASVTVPIVALQADAGRDLVTCGCAPVDLVGTGITSGCTGPLQYRWERIAPLRAWICGDDTTWISATGSTLPCSSADCEGTFELSVRCEPLPRCVATDRVDVEVELPPTPFTASADDPMNCATCLDVSWTAATFDSGAGVYNVYRSESDCAAALAAGPLVTGLNGLSWTDCSTLDGHSYLYVVSAEDAVPARACLPGGPFAGGAFTTACAAPRTEVANVALPDPACWTLRARHVFDTATMDWNLARPLLPGEHFHLLKASLSAAIPFAMINAESDLSLEYSETDTSAWLQFFDLRIANECEIQSGDDEPPGRDGLATCP